MQLGTIEIIFVSFQGEISKKLEKAGNEREDKCLENLLLNWPSMVLDHSVRYLARNSTYKEGDPIFIEVQGEWKISGIQLIMGNMAALAEEHYGFIIKTEHRYYGEGLPLINFIRDFSTEKLKYLQIEQALEDFAYFIDHFKQENPHYGNSKVIDRGMLVTWLRLRFPHIVDITYASSASLGVGIDYSGNLSSCYSKRLYQYEEVACLVMSIDIDDEEGFNSLVNFVVFKSEHIASCEGELTADDDPTGRTNVELSNMQKDGYVPNIRDRPDGRSQLKNVLKNLVGCEFIILQYIVCSFKKNCVTEHALRTGIEQVLCRYVGNKPKVPIKHFNNSRHNRPIETFSNPGRL
ncbi:hypothetical protein FQA39_LY16807 [Lamprigera yunnana]|nr:hypothetical protein FQA39_LY16807 [Lamprigera yunnana]